MTRRLDANAPNLINHHIVFYLSLITQDGECYQTKQSLVVSHGNFTLAQTMRNRIVLSTEVSLYHPSIMAKDDESFLLIY